MHHQKGGQLAIASTRRERKTVEAAGRAETRAALQERLGLSPARVMQQVQNYLVPVYSSEDTEDNRLKCGASYVLGTYNL